MTRDYLTTREAASFLGISLDRLKRKRLSGDFREGLHYFHPAGMKLRWKVAALAAYMEHGEYREDSEAIPLARGRRVA